MPVELIDFNAACSAKGEFLLTWSTASEQNNDYFAVERATPSGFPQGGGIQWEVVGAVKGAGNSSLEKKYEFIDESTLSIGRGAEGEVYYRLKQVDYNGKYQYFGPVATTCAVFPEWDLSLQNPVTDNLLRGTLVVPENSQLVFSVVDLCGKMLQQESFFAAKGADLFELGFDNVPAGIYILQCSSNNKVARRVVVRE